MVVHTVSQGLHFCGAEHHWRLRSFAQLQWIGYHVCGLLCTGKPQGVNEGTGQLGVNDEPLVGNVEMFGSQSVKSEQGGFMRPKLLSANIAF